MQNANIVKMILMVALWLFAATSFAQKTSNAKVEVAFQSDCEELVLDTIKKAKRKLHVAAFSFTRRSIAEALVDKAESGVKVYIKMDAHQAKSKFSANVLEILRDSPVELTLIKMPPYRHMHHKFVVADGRYVVTGSYNFTSAATKDNWENTVAIDNTKIGMAYVKEWKAVVDRRKK